MRICKIRVSGRIALLIGATILSSGASATTYTADSTNFKSIFYSVQGGDRIIVTGSFAAMQLRDRSFATPITIDARHASFTDSVQLKDVSGVNFSYGRFGSATTPTRSYQAVLIGGGSNINFSHATFIGNGDGMGLTFTNTDNINVSSSTFTSLRRGLAFTGVTNGVMTHNQFLKSSSDGAAIVDSHFVTASQNLCSGTSPAAGAHPDCIQLWSLAGHPVQSDITISDNTARGATQGFTSFDPNRGGGLRIDMLRNRVDTSYPQGIACYGCVDSLFADNVLTTLPGSRFRTSMNIVGGGNNVLRNNSIEAYIRRKTPGSTTGPTSDMVFDDLAETGGGFFDTGASPLSAAELARFAVSGVPEPSVWLQLMAGMLAIGAVTRRRRHAVTAAV